LAAGGRSSILVLVLAFGVLFSLLYLSSAFSVEKTSEALTVKTNKPSYDIRGTLIISGTLSNSILQDAGLPVLIQIFTPEGSLLRVDQVSVTKGDSGGSYTYEVKMGGSLGSIPGEYRVVVSYAEHQAKTSFNLG